MCKRYPRGRRRDILRVERRAEPETCNEKYEVRKGMTVYIPIDVEHQTRNTGEGTLCCCRDFAPPSGPSKREKQNWKQFRCPAMLLDDAEWQAGTQGNTTARIR